MHVILRQMGLQKQGGGRALRCVDQGPRQNIQPFAIRRQRRGFRGGVLCQRIELRLPLIFFVRFGLQFRRGLYEFLP